MASRYEQACTLEKATLHTANVHGQWVAPLQRGEGKPILRYWWAPENATPWNLGFWDGGRMARDRLPLYTHQLWPNS